MKEKIMPPLVLMLISAIVCGLLVLANSATKDKIVKAQEENSVIHLQKHSEKQIIKLLTSPTMV